STNRSRSASSKTICPPVPDCATTWWSASAPSCRWRRGTHLIVAFLDYGRKMLLSVTSQDRDPGERLKPSPPLPLSPSPHPLITPTVLSRRAEGRPRPPATRAPRRSP